MRRMLIQESKRSLRCYIAGAMWLLLSACVTDYEPKGVTQIRDLLVVDGIISNGETVIRLSRSVGLLSDFKGDEYVNNAQVDVEREDGTSYPAKRPVENGAYTIEVGELDPNVAYRLRITLEGEEYVSDYLKPVITPAIDTLSLLKEDQGQPVHVCVSTHNSPDASTYYRWIYKENWEVKAEMFAEAGIEYDDRGEPVIIYYDLQTSNNTYYCWGKDSSKVMALASSDKLTENVISNKRLITMEPDDKRLSILYHVAVEQYALRKEAYDYYFNLQKNIEESGGLFAPIPSELKGNVSCISNADIRAIGYVEVATVSRTKRFMPEIKDMYEPANSYCSASIIDGMPVMAGYSLMSYDPHPGGVTKSAFTRCLDCRRGATKNKPSWWPNDHL